MIHITDRLKAAYRAFRNPTLQWEAECLRDTVVGLEHTQRVALLSSMRINDWLTYHITMLPYRDEDAIRRYLGCW